MVDVEKPEEEGRGVVDEEEDVFSERLGLVEQTEQRRYQLQGLLLRVAFGPDLHEHAVLGVGLFARLRPVEHQTNDQYFAVHEGRRTEDVTDLDEGVVGVSHRVEGALVNRVGKVDAYVPREQLRLRFLDVGGLGQAEGGQHVGRLAAGRGHRRLVKVPDREALFGDTEQLLGTDLGLAAGEGDSEHAVLVEAVD